jgi:mRNA-degrading endonuclease RelE of RelBE toxin-antitoxin system
MADKIQKALAKLSAKERKLVEQLVIAIVSDNLHGLDVKHLKGTSNIFRVRKGNLRIIYSNTNKNIQIIQISHRNEKTYKDF